MRLWPFFPVDEALTASLDGIEGDKVGHKQGTSAIASGTHAGPTRSGVKLDVGISRTHADFDSGEETGGRKMETIFTLGLCRRCWCSGV